MIPNTEPGDLELDLDEEYQLSDRDSMRRLLIRRCNLAEESIRYNPAVLTFVRWNGSYLLFAHHTRREELQEVSLPRWCMVDSHTDTTVDIAYANDSMVPRPNVTLRAGYQYLECIKIILGLADYYLDK